MAFTYIQVEGAESVANGVLLYVQPDLTTDAWWATAADLTWRWP